VSVVGETVASDQIDDAVLTPSEEAEIRLLVMEIILLGVGRMLLSSSVCCHRVRMIVLRWQRRPVSAFQCEKVSAPLVTPSQRAQKFVVVSSDLLLWEDFLDEATTALKNSRGK
jgi:hypothetical protein